MMMTQNGKLLYISDNAAEYLGHSMVSVLKVSELFELLSLKERACGFYLLFFVVVVVVDVGRDDCTFSCHCLINNAFIRYVCVCVYVLLVPEFIFVY